MTCVACACKTPTDEAQCISCHLTDDVATACVLPDAKTTKGYYA